MSLCRFLWFFLLILAVPARAEEKLYDVVVYGGTSGGVAAAVQVRRMKKSVLLIEPSEHLGGLTSGGLGATDIGNKVAIGGLSREFYRRIKAHYQENAAWNWEAKEKYLRGGQEDAMWTFEPHVAEQIYRELVCEHDVEVVYGERLDLKRGVRKESGRIVSLQMESGKQVRGCYFIDATYEGDLMALAGVQYTVGREANVTYKETLNGVQTAQATKHQLRS